MNLFQISDWLSVDQSESFGNLSQFRPWSFQFQRSDINQWKFDVVHSNSPGPKPKFGQSDESHDHQPNYQNGQEMEFAIEQGLIATQSIDNNPHIFRYQSWILSTFIGSSKQPTVNCLWLHLWLSFILFIPFRSTNKYPSRSWKGCLGCNFQLRWILIRKLFLIRTTWNGRN